MTASSRTNKPALNCQAEQPKLYHLSAADCLFFGSKRAYLANTKHSANNSQNVPELLLLYENICITFGEYSISGNIINMFYECFHF